MGVIFQPSDDTVFRVKANNSPQHYVDITVAKIKEDVQQLNNLLVFCWLVRGEGDVYSVCCTNLNASVKLDPEIAHFATYPYIQYSYGGTMSYNLIGIEDGLKKSVYNLLYYNINSNRLENDTSLYWETHSDTVDGVKYWAFNYGGAKEGAIIYWGSGTPYLNNEPPVPPVVYNWQSVPSISGKNGILSLVTLESESINDGEPVSGADVSVFDQAPSNDNNIKNLADTYGGGEASSAVDVTVKYKVTLPPGGSFSTLKIVAKKDSIPEDVSDGDKIVDISPSKTKKTVTGLDENSMYYFKIFAEDTNSNTSESDEKHIMTSGDEGWSFDYTGQIQTFVAPKTGIYQLETWGAQGGDATDGTNTARGGYGSYAYGEVFLTQGDTLYINVGGQNGYGGGGNGSITYDVKNIAKTLDYEHIKSGSDITNLTEWYLTDWWLYFGQISQNRPFRYEDSTFYCLSEDASTAQNVQVHTLVTIPRLSNVVNIKFKIRRTQVRSGTQWNQLYLNFDHIGDNNSFNRDYIINVNSPVQEGNLIVATPNLNEWYEFETGEISISCIDYVEFVRTYAGYDIKDIEITCTT